MLVMAHLLWAQPAHADATHVGTAYGTSTLASVTVTTAVGTQRGDMLIAVVTRTASGSTNPPSGWKRVLTTTSLPDVRSSIFWRRADKDGATPYTFLSNTVSPTAATISSFSGVGILESPRALAGTGTDISTPPVAANTAGSMLVSAFSHASDLSPSLPPLMTSAARVAASGPTSVGLSVGVQTLAETGTIAGQTATAESSASNIGQAVVLTPDTTPASGAFGKTFPENVYVSGTFKVTGTTQDTGSGVKSVRLTFSGPQSGTICDIATQLKSWKCDWKTLEMPAGNYVVRLEIQDNANNPPFVVNRTVEVGPPRATLVKQPFKRLTGLDYHVASATTVFFNPTQAGSFRMSIKATAREAKVARVEFPAAPSGWTVSQTVDTLAPYEAVYTWEAGAISPGEMPVVAQTDRGGFSTFVYTVTADTQGPTASAPVVTTTGGGTKAKVTMSASTDAMSGSLLRQLQRRSSTVFEGVCGSFGPWTTVMAIAPVGTFTEPLPSGSGCYEYRMVLTDKVRNEGMVSGTEPLRYGADGQVPDREAPTATIAPLGGVIPSYAAVSGTANDDIKVTSLSLTYSGPKSGSICALTTVPASWTCTWDTTTLEDGTYTLSAEVGDAAGKVTTVTQPVVIDRQGPTASFAGITALTGAASVSATTQGTVYYNPAAAFSFAARVNAANPGSGIASVIFPAAGSDWTPASNTISTSTSSPYGVTYTHSANTLTVPGPVYGIVGVTDGLGRIVNVPLTFFADSAAPTGGSITYPGGIRNTASVAITLSIGTDALSGVAGSVLERQSAAMSAGGACGSYGQFAALTSSPTATFTDTTITSGNCYQYRLVVTDKVGNAAVYEHGSNAVSVDMDPPTGGNITYADGWASTATITFTQGTDELTTIGTPRVLERQSAAFNGTTCGTFTTWASVGSPNPVSPFVDTTAASATCYRYRYRVPDAAGNTALYTSLSTLRLDTTAPTGGSITYTNGWINSTSASITFTDGTDAQSGIGTPRMLERRTASLTGTTCGTYPDQWTQVGANNPTSPTTDTVTTGTCYQYRYRVSDAAGNVATYSSTAVLRVDATPPGGGSISHATGWFTSTSAQLTFSNGTDAQSGIGTPRVLERQTAALNGATCGSYGTWTPVGASNPTSPYTDAVVSGSCYRWRYIVPDNAGNSVTYEGPGDIKIDATAPTGGSVSYVNGWVNTTSTSITFADGTDTLSGLGTGRKLERQNATITSGNCGAYSGWSQKGPSDLTGPYTDASLTSGTCYRYRYVVPDVAGNTVQYVSAHEIKVDTAAPSNPGQSAIFDLSTTFNADKAWSNSLTALSASWNTGSDTLSGLASYDVCFSSVNTGCTNIPGTTTQTGNTNRIATATAASMASAATYYTCVRSLDGAGNMSGWQCSSGFTIDTAAPSGGSISYANGWRTALSVPITLGNGTDALSGVGTPRVLERSFATMTGATCGSYEPWTTIATNPTASFTDTTVSSGRCYIYRYTVPDNAGNPTTYTSANVATVDAIAPNGTIGADPAGPINYSATTFTGTTSDASGISRVQLKFSGPATGTICNLQPPTSANWSCAWVPTGQPNGIYTLLLEVTDLAGNREATAITRTIAIDTTTPTGTFSGTVPAAIAQTTAISGTATDVGSGVKSVRVTHSGPAQGTICTLTPPAGTTWSCNLNTLPLPDGTYTLTLEVTDYANFTNSSAITRSVIVDNTAPMGTLNSLPPSITESFDVTGTVTDAGSGLKQVDVAYTNGVNQGTICSFYVVPNGPWTCPWNTIPINPKGNYTVVLRIWDNAGNREAFAITRTTTLY
jgi:hypothetical protein